MVATTLLVERVIQETRGQFEHISSLGTPFKWSDLLQCEEVFILPQNISTMTMFELATAGVPVSVPDRAWMKQLRLEYPQLLVELSFAQLENSNTDSFHIDDPNNWKSERFIDWWLDRADFYDLDLMPNVTLISSFDELANPRSVPDKSAHLEKIRIRNSHVQSARSALVRGFASKIAPRG
jgi:hypothetical protein